MLGCTPYSDGEEKVVMRSAEEIQEYYDYLERKAEQKEQEKEK